MLTDMLYPELGLVESNLLLFRVVKGGNSSSLLQHKFRDGTYLLKSKGGRGKIILGGGSSRKEYWSNGRDYQGDGDVEREDVRNVTRL